MFVDAMGEEWILSEAQVRALLDWIGEHVADHRSVHLLLVTVAEGPLRPSEACSLRVRDLVLHSGGSGELAARHQGKARAVPLQSRLAARLRGWISEAGLQENDLLFPGPRGGRLSAATYQRLWRQAQEAVLPHDELLSWRLGEPVDILWESRLVQLLKLGVDVVTVAELAGVHPAWLALRYPYCFLHEATETDGDCSARAASFPESTAR
ncbi:tyrosine-type recombinase/integrase [Streptomyces sp. CFMR 7]|uniref:tyrosine-type recombinase/integrase n=1 Tax=Streptomyces sp. CFMR 7 TaxID=1649184 RepID=UPI00119E6FA2|nr:tyrosine-type recombinase/integrase [Streptomyces sp. CFMR 7]